MKKLTNRSEAKSLGLTRYYTGKPCRNSHIDERITSNGRCVTCSNIFTAKFKKQNAGKINAQNIKRKLLKNQRTPKWLTKDQILEIQKFYELAKQKSINERYEVDHIIPLNGAKVSGLHVPWNLQILSAKENNIKGNRYVE